MKIILLGTGSPKPDPNRQGPGVVLQIDNANLLSELIAKYILASSSLVGRIASRAGVKNLVLTHFREKSEHIMRSLEADVRQDFRGNLILGQDLLTIDV